jgi:hypothetical protein
MRKALWIILAVLVVAIGAPYAQADAFVYSYTVTFDPPLYGATFTTKPMQAVTAPNAILTATDLRSYSLTGSFYLGTLDEFICPGTHNLSQSEIAGAKRISQQQST